MGAAGRRVKGRSGDSGCIVCLGGLLLVTVVDPGVTPYLEDGFAAVLFAQESQFFAQESQFFEEACLVLLAFTKAGFQVGYVLAVLLFQSLENGLGAFGEGVVLLLELFVLGEQLAVLLLKGVNGEGQPGKIVRQGGRILVDLGDFGKEIEEAVEFIGDRADKDFFEPAGFGL